MCSGKAIDVDSEYSLKHQERLKMIGENVIQVKVKNHDFPECK